MNRTELKAAICGKAGIERFNPMQEAMMASDAPATILIAPTGSGKTLAFTANMLTCLGKPSGQVQALILAPSRELVTQIAEIVRRVAVGLKTVAFYGGHRMQEEINSLSAVPDIIVATPGRLLDHLQRGTLVISDPRVLVTDEYDKILELGFEGEMKRIASRIGRPGRILLTSATKLDELPPYLGKRRTETIVTETTDPRKRTAVVQVESPSRDKLDTLVALLESLPQGKAIVFTGHRESTERVYKALRRHKLPAALYHGGLEQNDRSNAVDMLANGTAPILVATDLAARGLDITELNYVIHYHMPVSVEAWTHRNGRTARQDTEGTVYVLTSEADNVPEYVKFDRSYNPTGRCDNPISSDKATLYFNVGKKEKISRGDIAGFLMAKCGLAPDEVGLITVRDHCALVAVPASKADSVARTASAERIKGKKARVSVMGR